MYFTRNPPGKELKAYMPNTRGPCYDEKDNPRDAFSLETDDTIVLCPGAWDKPANLLCQEHTQMPWGTSIVDMTTVGSDLYHELTHLRLNSKL